MKQHRRCIKCLSDGASIQKLVSDEQILLLKEVIENLMKELSDKAMAKQQRTDTIINDEHALMVLKTGVILAIADLMTEGKAIVISKDLEDKWNVSKH